MWTFISLDSTQPYYTFILSWNLIVLVLFLSQNCFGYSRLFAFLEKPWNQLIKLQTCLLRFWLQLRWECGAFLVAGGSVVKKLFAMQEPKAIQVWSLGRPLLYLLRGGTASFLFKTKGACVNLLSLAAGLYPLTRGDQHSLLKLILLWLFSV